MWWRLKRAEFERGQGEANRLAMKAIVEAGRTPGILGYVEGVPVAWCSVAPRSEYGALERSRVLRRIDDAEVWSIVCFFIARPHRGAGMLEAVIRAAVDHVRREGGRIVEAYPTVTRSGTAPPTSSFMGFPEIFERVGFVEVAQPSASKRIVRYLIPTR
jgi:predicted GNAT family acetyltransferase